MKENQIKEVRFSNGEVMEYLEEMIISDLAEAVEERVYQDIKWFGKCSKSDLNKIKINMKKWYKEVF